MSPLSAIAFCPSCCSDNFVFVGAFEIPKWRNLQERKNSDNFGSQNEVQKIIILRNLRNAETELVM